MRGEKREEQEERQERCGEDIRTQPERRMESGARERREDRSGRGGRGKWSWGKKRKDGRRGLRRSPTTSTVEQMSHGEGARLLMAVRAERSPRLGRRAEVTEQASQRGGREPRSPRW